MKRLFINAQLWADRTHMALSDMIRAVNTVCTVQGIDNRMTESSHKHKGLYNLNWIFHTKPAVPITRQA